MLNSMNAKFDTHGWVEFIVGIRSPRGRFQVVRVMPSDQGEPKYRVKGEKEAFERIASESELRRWSEM